MEKKRGKIEDISPRKNEENSDELKKSSQTKLDFECKDISRWRT